jgi:hypothetical protein
MIASFVSFRARSESCGMVSLKLDGAAPPSVKLVVDLVEQHRARPVVTVRPRRVPSLRSRLSTPSRSAVRDVQAIVQHHLDEFLDPGPASRTALM